MIELKVLKRDGVNTNVYLREQGLVPAIMYGSDFENIMVSVEDIEFRKVYRDAGTSNVITTTGDVAGEMVLVQGMQVHPVSGAILHIDFKVVNKGETTEVVVPIKLKGESPAVKNNIGILNFIHEEVNIETIPNKIPDHIEIDITKLETLGDGIKISDMVFADGIKILDDVDTTVVNIIAIKEETESEPLSAEDMQPERIGEKKETTQDTE